MRIGWICLALATYAVTASVGLGLAMPLIAMAQSYPFQGQSFVADGVVSQVDVDRERVIFVGDAGKRYTLDTSQSDITLLDGNRAGMTNDLAAGMRIHVSGHLLSAGIAEVDQIRVLTDSKPARTHPTLPAGPSGPHHTATRADDIDLRGTVESINIRNGSFVVRVNDHTRTVLLADNTDLSGLGQTAPDRFPVKAGDRVTVAGLLQPDGTVLAGVISLSRNVSLPVTASPRTSLLHGRISSTSNRYTSRDIKIRLSDSNREIKIKVPRGISILQSGREISVHDLSEDEPVRVTGAYEGVDFRAARIEVERVTGSSQSF